MSNATSDAEEAALIMRGVSVACAACTALIVSSVSLLLIDVPVDASRASGPDRRTGPRTGGRVRYARVATGRRWVVRPAVAQLGGSAYA
ncbi:hypothetical protein [Kribbella sp. NBC_00889]|uniref:hypothetical protein n=1 Tax=Kribbella sp. NBC_00889 TaxID=2975974 RepID=UPI00386742B3|nr:hypothetical protein OG817_31300 [Kribbella sp. NBC_00889]